MKLGVGLGWGEDRDKIVHIKFTGLLTFVYLFIFLSHELEDSHQNRIQQRQESMSRSRGRIPEWRKYYDRLREQRGRSQEETFLL